MKPKGLNKFTVCDDVAQVETTKGDIFYISLEAMEYIKSYTWSLHTRGYPVAHIKGKRVFLHNFLMSPPKGFVVDHIDGNPKNNTYNNLRLVTPEDNMLNKKTYKNSKIFRGLRTVKIGKSIWSVFKFTTKRNF